MAAGAGYTAWKLAFQLSPIILYNGLVQNFPGSILPIIGITELINLPAGLLGGQSDFSSLDNFFAHFAPIPGSTLVDQDIAEYPFANQSVAANATIQKPLRVSMLMTAPARNELGYYVRFAIFLALKAALQQHVAVGGSFIVITPTAVYNNCLLTALRDVSGNYSKQPQTTWQWDFTQPLITLADVQQATSSMLSKIDAGLQSLGNPTWSNLAGASASPASLTGASILPTTATGALGGGIAAPGYNASLAPITGTPLAPVGQ